MHQRNIIILTTIILLIPFALGAVKPNYPACLVLSNSGTSIDSDCNGIIDQANNSLFLNGLSSSSFALMSNLSAYYLKSNPQQFINSTVALNYCLPFNASCNGNEVLRYVFAGNVSNSFACVNVTSSSATGNITVDSLSVNTLNFLRPGFVTVQNGDGSMNITNNASMTGGASDGTGGWINTSTTTSTNFNFSVQGRLIYQGQSEGFDINQTFVDFSNNYGARWLNSTGDVEDGMKLDTNNCWHIGWSIIDCRN